MKDAIEHDSDDSVPDESRDAVIRLLDHFLVVAGSAVLASDQPKQWWVDRRASDDYDDDKLILARIARQFKELFDAYKDPQPAV